MTHDIVDSKGNIIAIGPELSRGGEGVVYVVSETLLAKLYTRHPSVQREQKLRWMVEKRHRELDAVAAMPSELLYRRRDSRFAGFLMRRVPGEPIHHYYSPGQRKHRFPNVEWSFLVNAALNTAIAFAQIHSKNIVIGDVNENSVFVGENATVNLIDCDSFQVIDGNSVLHCEVGVPIFLPPELQGGADLSQTMRTHNHDNFGLAVIIFSLLLMGRHPYSGVPLDSASSDELPVSIRKYAYAFSRNAAKFRVAPPPNAISPTLLGDQISYFFERAFTNLGTEGTKRPRATDWIEALSKLRQQLRRCQKNSSHLHIGNECFWCSAVVDFFPNRGKVVSGTPFNVEQAWRQIESHSRPVAITFPIGKSTDPPVPLPAGNTGGMIVVGVLALAGCFFPPIWILAIIVYANLGNPREEELSRRRIILRSLEAKLNELKREWANAIEFPDYMRVLDELRAAKTQLACLPTKRADRIAKLALDAQTRQKNAYLRGKFIRDYNIRDIGPTRVATLTSFGIETAFDVEPRSIRRIGGFGAHLTKRLLDWRKQMEDKFVFDPSADDKTTEIARIDAELSTEQRRLEATLLSGPEKLTEAKRLSEAKLIDMVPAIIETSKAYAFAEVNFRAQ